MAAGIDTGVNPATARLRLLILQPTPFCNIDSSYCYPRVLDDPDRLFDIYVRHGISEVRFDIEDIEGANMASSLAGTTRARTIPASAALPSATLLRTDSPTSAAAAPFRTRQPQNPPRRRRVPTQLPLFPGGAAAALRRTSCSRLDDSTQPRRCIAR
jgi:hypothetical protein